MASKSVNIQPGSEGGIDITDGVGKCKSNLLYGGRTRLANVVATDADRIPAWKMLGTVTEDISNNAHGVLGRVNIGTARNVLFQNIVLYSAGELIYFHALFLRDCDVEC